MATPRIQLACILLFGISGCCLLGEDLTGPGEFRSVAELLSAAKSPSEERYAIDELSSALSPTGGAFADSYAVGYHDAEGAGIAIERIPRWLMAHPTASLYVKLSYRGQGRSIEQAIHKLIDRENWWRFMLGE